MKYIVKYYDEYGDIYKEPAQVDNKEEAKKLRHDFLFSFISRNMKCEILEQEVDEEDIKPIELNWQEYTDFLDKWEADLNL